MDLLMSYYDDEHDEKGGVTAEAVSTFGGLLHSMNKGDEVRKYALKVFCYSALHSRYSLSTMSLLRPLFRPVVCKL